MRKRLPPDQKREMIQGPRMFRIATELLILMTARILIGSRKPTATWMRSETLTLTKMQISTKTSRPMGKRIPRKTQILSGVQNPTRIANLIKNRSPTKLRNPKKTRSPTKVQTLREIPSEPLKLRPNHLSSPTEISTPAIGRLMTTVILRRKPLNRSAADS